MKKVRRPRTRTAVKENGCVIGYIERSADPKWHAFLAISIWSWLPSAWHHRAIKARRSLIIQNNEVTS